ALASFVDWSLTEVLTGVEGAPGLDRVDVVQPVLFAVMVSLARLWRSYGVEPAAVLGHSQGEIAAAYVAGALSLEDAARVVSLRSKAILALSGAGGMVSVAVGRSHAEALIAEWDGRLSVAAINGAGSTVVSGEAGAITEFLDTCERQEVRARRIPVDYASHSVQVEAIQAELLDVLSAISPKSGDVAFHSTVRGRRIDTVELDASYWYENLRHEVLFDPVVRDLLERDFDAFVEISPHPV
ncbi:acyltransferase domain-containing protein, partial [Amycolatopsis minnesotensis]|uniref:acyltransferase domain-containing protein n=1 Tax=Amycolatopsis minnesotensis TaxID=337894 RepID=UPI0031D99BE3